MFAVSALAGLIVFLLIWRPMRRLLGANTRLEQARPFFCRTAFLVLILGAVAPAVGKRVDLPEGSAFMEYVWQAAGLMEDTLIYVGLYLFGFAILMTILTVASGRSREQ